MRPSSWSWATALATSFRLRHALLLRPPITAAARLLPPSPEPRHGFFPSAHPPGGARGFFGPRMDPSAPGEEVSYISQRVALEMRQELTGPLGFTVDQLLELEGLSVASAIEEVYKVKEFHRILVVCGPGSNGGDGLVAARHLHHFGYKPTIYCPVESSNTMYTGLFAQLKSLSIPFLIDLPRDLSVFDIIIDAIFGFSYRGKPSLPFDDIIQRIVSSHKSARKRNLPVVSIDVPSGWHVDEGDVTNQGINPDMLISLSVPKLCAKKFCGPHHFLGGRFIPPPLGKKFDIYIPPYPGTSTCLRIGRPPSVDISSLRENYISPDFLEDQVAENPLEQFRIWFEDAVVAGLREPNAMVLSTVNIEGKPSSRIVLLKGIDDNGFVWYTNYQSRKACQISENPHASLLFYWAGLNRQVRVEGTVRRVSREESETYFHSRPRGSQIGALVSKQSSIIAGRQIIHEAHKALQEKYSDETDVPLPETWGGFRLTPTLLEFWQGQPSRLHDRIQYNLEDIDGQRIWKINRLAP